MRTPSTGQDLIAIGAQIVVVDYLPPRTVIVTAL